MAKNHKGKKRTGNMRLTDFDLKQMDEKYLAARTQEQLMRLSVRLLGDLKEARDRLNRTPGNSSMPPSSQAPWPGTGPAHSLMRLMKTRRQQTLSRCLSWRPRSMWCSKSIAGSLI